ncbi:MAG: response regulator transcription factor [Polyangiaceae bacterium]
MSHDLVLLVEDDVELGKQMSNQLKTAGFDVNWVTTGDQAVGVDLVPCRLVVLDLMLPGIPGLDVLKRIRARSDVPVVVLSARNDTASKVRALQLGADDYLTKPFFPEELEERIRARLRRPLLQRESVLVNGRVEIDVAGYRVNIDGTEVKLTRVEFNLLVALARRPGASVSRRWLAENVLDPDRDGTERTLDVHVSRLRKKLGDRALIATVWGVGYRLDAAQPSQPS